MTQVKSMHKLVDRKMPDVGNGRPLMSNHEILKFAAFELLLITAAA